LSNFIARCQHIGQIDKEYADEKYEKQRAKRPKDAYDKLIANFTVSVIIFEKTY
jgi:hypothetical protein